MSRRIDFTPRARSQFLAAMEYIRAERPSAARTLRGRSMEALKRLSLYPESGRTIPEFSELGFREILVGRYRFFYRLHGDVVWVVGVWHDAQIPDDPA